MRHNKADIAGAAAGCADADILGAKVTPPKSRSLACGGGSGGGVAAACGWYDCSACGIEAAATPIAASGPSMIQDCVVQLPHDPVWRPRQYLQ